MKAFFRTHILTFVLLVVFALPLSVQLFQPGFFVGDDGEWMIIRSSAFHEAIRDGQIPVRYTGRLNNEYGYPVTTFLYPGYLYLTEPLNFVHIGFINSIKVMFTLTMVLSGVFAYFWFAKLFKKWPSLIGALVYLYTPYHLVDMYNRGSLGELLALAVVPFIFWNIERKSLLFTSIGIAMLLLSHNILAAFFLPIILLYAFLRNEEKFKKKLLSLGLLTLFGLGLASFFWIPALFELQYTVFNQTKISEWQNYFASYAQIGGLPVAILGLSVLLLIFRKHFSKAKSLIEVTNHTRLFIFFTVAGLLSVFFSSFFSTALWHVLPVTFIQFPFRFLSLEIVAVAFLSAYILNSIRDKKFQLVYSIIIVLCLAINATPYFLQIKSFDKGEGFYVTNQSTTTTRDEYMPIWVKQKPVERAAKKIEIIKGEGTVSSIIVTNKTISFSVGAKTDAVVQINKIYWPGWSVQVDGNSGEILYGNPKGVMTVNLSKGNHTVHLSFTETPLRLFADILSVITFIMLIGVLVWKTKKHHKK